MSDKAKDQKFEYISHLKTVSILVVVIYHCFLFYADEPFFPVQATQNVPACIFIDYFFSIFHNPALFMCSGFLFAHSLFNKNRTIPQMILNRSKRLILTYYIYGFLWLVPTYTFLNVNAYGRPENAGYLEGFKYMILGVFSDPLWFLWALFWTTLFYILISPVIKKRWYPVSIILTLAFYFLIKYPLADFPYFKISQLCPIILAFYLGIVLYDADKFFNKLPVWVLLSFTFIMYANGVVFACCSPTYPTWEAISKAAGAFGSYCLFLAIHKLGLFKRFFGSKFFAYTDKKSFNIYLLHTTFLYLAFRMIYPMIGEHVLMTIILIAFETYLHTYLATYVQDMVKGGFSRIVKRLKKD